MQGKHGVEINVLGKGGIKNVKNMDFIRIKGIHTNLSETDIVRNNMRQTRGD